MHIHVWLGWRLALHEDPVWFQGCWVEQLFVSLHHLAPSLITAFNCFWSWRGILLRISERLIFLLGAASRIAIFRIGGARLAHDACSNTNTPASETLSCSVCQPCSVYTHVGPCVAMFLCTYAPVPRSLRRSLPSSHPLLATHSQQPDSAFVAHSECAFLQYDAR